MTRFLTLCPVATYAEPALGFEPRTAPIRTRADWPVHLIVYGWPVCTASAPEYSAKWPPRFATNRNQRQNSASVPQSPAFPPPRAARLTGVR